MSDGFDDRAWDDADDTLDVPTVYSAGSEIVSTVWPARKAKVLPHGPGFFMSLLWMVVLIVVQIAITIPAYFLPLVFGKRDHDALTPFAFATAGTLLAGLAFVWFEYGTAAPAKLAIRFPGWKQSGLLLLLILPLLLTLVEGTACLADLGRGIGLPNWMIDLDGIREMVDALRQLDPRVAAVSVAVFAGILPGVGEELFFRGFVGRGLVAKWGPMRGVMVTSLLFGAIHIHPLQAAFAVIMGVILHAVYLWTRSLLAPMILHAGYNTLAMAWNVAGDASGEGHVPAHLALAALVAAAGVLLLLYRCRVRWVEPDRSEWSPRFPSAEMPPREIDARPVSGRLGFFGPSVAAVLYAVFVAIAVREVVR